MSTPGRDTCGVCGAEVRWDSRVGGGWTHRDQAAAGHAGVLGTPVPRAPQPGGSDEEPEPVPPGPEMLPSGPPVVVEDWTTLPTSPASMAKGAQGAGWLVLVTRVEGLERDGWDSYPYVSVRVRCVRGPALVWASWISRSALADDAFKVDACWQWAPILRERGFRDEMMPMVKDPRLALLPEVYGPLAVPVAPKERKPRAAKKKTEKGGQPS